MNNTRVKLTIHFLLSKMNSPHAHHRLHPRHMASPAPWLEIPPHRQIRRPTRPRSSPLPPHIDPAVISEFDFRRVLATGTLRHDQEMLVGPRMRNGEDGYMVITPLERKDGSTILVNRGWISKKHRDQRTRPDSLVKGEVTIEGLLREPWKKNRFTPENRPDKGEFYFPDVHQMAALTGSQPVWVEATMGK